MPYVHTLIRPMNMRTPSVDPDPSAVSGASRRFSLLPSRESARRRRWHQFQETTRDFDPKYTHDIVICCCCRGATSCSSWESSSLLPAGTSFRDQNTTQRGTRMTYSDRSSVFCATLVDALKELAGLDLRHMPFHTWHNRAAGHLR